MVLPGFRPRPLQIASCAAFRVHELGLPRQQLEARIPSLFTDAACGRVLRVKGFVRDAGGWVELNATADGLTAAPIPAGQEVLIVIGEGLDKERIEAVLRN